MENKSYPHSGSVYQMSILEVENTGEGTPQGVVLVLVGPEPCSPSFKDQESLRTLRMYNLASLTSLAKWAVAQKVRMPWVLLYLYITNSNNPARERVLWTCAAPPTGTPNKRQQRDTVLKAASHGASNRSLILRVPVPHLRNPSHRLTITFSLPLHLPMGYLHKATAAKLVPHLRPLVGHLPGATQMN